MDKRLCFVLMLFAFLLPATFTFAQHPSWSYQSNIYEVNLRQFTKAGTFRAFERSLPRLKKMGVEILWFMPITPIGLVGRKGDESEMGSYYSVKDYFAVNPDYGTMKDWKNVVQHAHAMGFKVIIDWVPNHSSPDNPWIRSHPDFYKKDSAGNPAIPFDWSDTRQLNYDNRELRDSMIMAMKWWLTETNVDGFRCDVAWNVPEDFWKEAITELHKIKNVFMLAEGDKPSLHEAGFDETYPWNIMNVAYGIYSGKTTLTQLDSTINYNDNAFPKNAFRLFFTTNHDENSWNGTEFERFGEGYKTFAVWAFTMKNSVPLIYSGQEEPNKKRLKFFVKDTIPWNKYALSSFYKTLTGLRRASAAFAADASFRQTITGSSSDVYVYFREKKGKKALVILNFSNKKQQLSLKDNLVTGDAKNLFSGATEKLSKTTTFDLQPWGYLVYDYLPKK